MESSQTLTALEKKQNLLAHHVRLLAKKMSHALFVFGSQGGLGKSRTILQVLDEHGVDPIIINSHITPLALYGTLFQHRDDAVLFFDDVDSMYSSMPHLGLLRSALWGNPRIVTYGSSQLSDLPSSFEFTSRCIFAANVIPKNDAFKAVLSRCDQFELSATNQEVLEMMRNLSAQGFHGVTLAECESVIDYIEHNSEDRQLSLRLLGPSLRKLKYAREEGIDWRPLIKSQLMSLGRKQVATKRLDNKSVDAKVMKQAIEKHPDSPADQQAYWCNTTQKSRASYFRARQRFQKTLEESE
jgi:hypothetical protein